MNIRGPMALPRGPMAPMAMPRGPMAMPRGPMAMPRDVMHVCVERCAVLPGNRKFYEFRGASESFGCAVFPGDHGNIKITVTDHGNIKITVTDHCNHDCL